MVLDQEKFDEFVEGFLKVTNPDPFEVALALAELAASIGLEFDPANYINRYYEEVKDGGH